jgi:hypothetical protein
MIMILTVMTNLAGMNQKMMIERLFNFEKIAFHKVFLNFFKIHYLENETKARKFRPYDRKKIISRCQISIFMFVAIFNNPNEYFLENILCFRNLIFLSLPRDIFVTMLF